MQNNIGKRSYIKNSRKRERKTVESVNYYSGVVWNSFVRFRSLFPSQVHQFWFVRWSTIVHENIVTCLLWELFGYATIEIDNTLKKQINETPTEINPLRNPSVRRWNTLLFLILSFHFWVIGFLYHFMINNALCWSK
jgi:hypothetical protein